MGRIYEVKVTVSVTQRVEADSYAEAELIMKRLLEDKHKLDSDDAHTDYVIFTGEVW
jgi:hypothetical protein